jgi:hypothetical protein
MCVEGAGGEAWRDGFMTVYAGVCHGGGRVDGLRGEIVGWRRVVPGG